MKFAAYIQRQKDLIKSRRTVFVFAAEEKICAAGDRDRLLAELENLKGLNKAERLALAAERA